MIAPSGINFDLPMDQTQTEGNRDFSTSKTIRTLQLGMAWFAEQPGGLDRYYYDMLKALPSVDVNARGVVCGSAAVELSSGGIVRALAERTAFMPKRLLAFRQGVRDEMRSFKPDVVGSHFALYSFPALGSIKSKPLVTHFHGPWHKESKFEGAGWLNCLARFHMERAVYKRADRLITLSNFFKQELVSSFGIDEAKIRVIPGGVDTKRFAVTESRRAARTLLDWPVDRPIIFAVRRLTQRMGLENVIKATALLRDKFPDALVMIAGKGKIREELQQRIDSLGLQNHVKLLGYLPDENLPLAYRAADLSIVPSLGLEGFGLVAAECLAAGTPVIATPVGGLPELIRPLREHLMTAGTSPADLAESMSLALANPGDLPGAEECRDYASQYDWCVVAKSLREVFSSLL